MMKIKAKKIRLTSGLPSFSLDQSTARLARRSFRENQDATRVISMIRQLEPSPRGMTRQADMQMNVRIIRPVMQFNEKCKWAGGARKTFCNPAWKATPRQ